MAAIKPVTTNVSPNAPHNDIEFATIGIGNVIFAIGFHGNPVHTHSRNHNTSVHSPANTNGRVPDATRVRIAKTNGHTNTTAPNNANPNNAGNVQIANCAANSGTTYMECSVHQNIDTLYVAPNGIARNHSRPTPSQSFAARTIRQYAAPMEITVNHHILNGAKPNDAATPSNAIATYCITLFLRILNFSKKEINRLPTQHFSLLHTGVVSSAYGFL